MQFWGRATDLPRLAGKCFDVWWVINRSLSPTRPVYLLKNTFKRPITDRYWPIYVGFPRDSTVISQVKPRL